MAENPSLYEGYVTYSLEEPIQDRMSFLHFLFLEGLCEVLERDPGVVGPQVGLNTGLIHQLRTFIHEEEQLVVFCCRIN